MTDGRTETEENPIPGERPFVTADDFAQADIEAPLVGLATADAFTISNKFIDAARIAEAQGQEREARVYGLLNAICTIHLRPEDRASPWGPMAGGTSWRTSVPEDFRGEQSAVLAGLLDGIENPALRARLADIVWTNDRKLGRAAKVAYDAYCEVVEGLLSKRFIPAYDVKGIATLEESGFLQRALQLAYATNKKKAPLPDRVTAALHALYDRASSDGALVVFVRTAELGLYYGLLDETAVAEQAERVASATSEDYPMALQVVWDLAAHIYDKHKDEVAKKRCQIGSLRQILAMRKQVSSAGAEAHWVMTALQGLRHIKGEEDLEEELEKDLRRLQRASMKEMVGIPIEFDITEQREQALKVFEELDLPSALKKFALLTRSLPIDELKKQARESIKQSPLSAMLGGVHMDDEGKPLANTPGADTGEPSEAWFNRKIGELEGFRRIHNVGALIDPVRMMLFAKFQLAERHFAPIVASSPFTPPGHEHLIVLGFTRFFQGDFMCAAHLLIPQLEACFRRILKVNGHAPVRRYDDGTEEDLDLGGMLEQLRPELETTFGPDMLYEIELLFHIRPGPRLRHELAHGHLSAGDCFHPNALYADWLIYRLTCLFLLRDWDVMIAPAIVANT